MGLDAIESARLDGAVRATGVVRPMDAQRRGMVMAASKAIETANTATDWQRLALLVLEVARLDERQDGREPLLSAAAELAGALGPSLHIIDLAGLCRARAALAAFIAHESTLAAEPSADAVDAGGRIAPALEALAIISRETDRAARGSRQCVLNAAVPAPLPAPLTACATIEMTPNEAAAYRGDVAAWLEMVEDYAMIEERPHTALFALMLRRSLTNAPNDRDGIAAAIIDVIGSLVKRLSEVHASLASHNDHIAAYGEDREGAELGALVRDGYAALRALNERTGASATAR